MVIYQESTIKELVENNKIYHLLNDKLDIKTSDYSKTFKQVCSENQLNYPFIKKLLKTYDANCEFPFEELNECSVIELLDYLKKSHHYYLKKKLPEMELTAIQVFKNYNETHTLLSYLCVFFNSYKKQLVEHIQFEEKKLFPYIAKLIDIDTKNADSEEIMYVLNTFSTREFICNHAHIEDELQEVRSLILKYTSASKLPLPFNVFLNQLHYFEIELNKHALIEDEILIPKVIDLEAHLLKKAAKHSLTQNSFA